MTVDALVKFFFGQVEIYTGNKREDVDNIDNVEFEVLYEGETKNIPEELRKKKVLYFHTRERIKLYDQPAIAIRVDVKKKK